MTKNCFLLSAGAGAVAAALACTASGGPPPSCLIDIVPDVTNNDDCTAAGAEAGYVDPNGGCNFESQPFQSLGTLGVPSSTNIVGTLGTFIPFGGADFTSRDLDWYTFTITDCAEVNVTLRMNNRNGEGGAIGFADSIIFLAPDGCPLATAFYALAGPSCSHSTGPIVLSAGTYMLVLTLPFETVGSEPYPIYNCPAPYECELDINPLAIGAGACGNNGSCAETFLTGGCEDCACCSIVCGQDTDCCDVAWDADCVNLAVEFCGLFIYDCTPGTPANNCATAAMEVEVGDAVCTSTIGATTDGPNGLASFCTAGIGKDIWFMMVAPGDGELVIDACAVDFDSVVAVYNIGTSPAFNPEDFTSFPGACADDTCGVLAGGSAITLVNVTAGDYYLIRLGGFFDQEDPKSEPAEGTGLISFGFNYEAIYNGPQQSSVQLATGDSLNLGLSSGFQIGTFTQRWCAVPFTLEYPVSGNPWLIEAIVGKGFIPAGVTNDRICWVIWERTGQSTPGAMVAEGCCCEDGKGGFVLPFNYDDPRDTSATGAWRLGMDPAMELAEGDYYLTLYGSNGDPADMAPSNWAWFIYALDGIPLINTSLPSVDGRFGYRSETPAGFLVYTGLEGVWEVQPDDSPVMLYTNAFTVLASAECAVNGDRNGNGCIDGVDLSMVTGQWDPLGTLGNGYGPGDANCDGKVDGLDIAVVTGNWDPLGCCPLP